MRKNGGLGDNRRLWKFSHRDMIGYVTADVLEESKTEGEEIHLEEVKAKNSKLLNKGNDGGG